VSAAGHLPLEPKPELRAPSLPFGFLTLFYFIGVVRRAGSEHDPESASGPTGGLAEGRRSEMALEIYRMAALQTADHWMITDSDGIIVEVNPAFESVTGYSQNELVGRKPNVIKSGLHDRAFYEGMWKTLLSGRTYRGVVVNRRKDGSLFYEMKTITPVKDSSGRTTHFFSIGKDISDLKVAERNLRESASELEQANRRLLASEASLLRHITILESVLSGMTEGVIVADRDGRFVIFNSAAEQMVGIGLTQTHPDEWSVQYGVYLPDGKTPYPTNDLPLVRAIRGEPTENVELFIRNPKNEAGVYLSVRGAPLKDKGGDVIGGLIVTRDITQDKWAKQAKEELDATREEMKTAERIQRALFPSHAPEAEGIDIGGATRPAVATGGDYFDYVELPDGDILLILGDVSGHGLGPALLMASVRAYVRALAESGVLAQDILTIVNRLVANDTEAGEFVTLIIARLDPATRLCDYASAGHTTGYVLDPAGRVKRSLESIVPPLAVLSDLSGCEMVSLSLEDGDVLILLTDGIIEAENSAGTPFGVERALDVAHRNRRLRASVIVDLLHKAVLEHSAGRIQDDISSIVVKILPRPLPDI
jgi:sigma-B regulation protein RsbU (phosphoserine phosphatase)